MKTYIRFILGIIIVLAFLFAGCMPNEFVNNLMYGRTSDTTTQPVRVDSSTHTIQTIRYGHHEIHAGSSYTVADTVAVNTATAKWQITTPNTVDYAHMVFQLGSTGEALYLVTEGADRNDGTNLPSINRRRTGIIPAAGLVVSRTPVGGTTDGATVLFSMRNGITNIAGKNIEGSTARATNEWILAPNTKYIISVTTFADVHVTMVLDWYEHTDKGD